ncbi:MAG: DMT family transporter, partial [Microcoleus sp. SIO2G3]|nr:DMT family transporter [Microcoleus sp. SIO2G3]
MILGGLPLLALSGLFETDQVVNLQLADWMALSYSTIFGSAIAYGLFFYFASSSSLTSLSSLTFLTPIFALLFGNLFLAEVLSPLQWFGVGLTLVSIYLINQRDQLAERFRWWRQVPELAPETLEPLRSSQSPADLAIAISAEVAEAEAETLS